MSNVSYTEWAFRVIMCGGVAVFFFCLFMVMVEAWEAPSTALRCDIVASVTGGADTYDIYAVKAHTRERVARAIEGAGRASMTAAVVCPVTKETP